MMGHGEKMESGDEVDRLTRIGQRVFLNRAGKAKKIKKRFTRRTRREAKQQLLKAAQ